jgi:DNA-directed RNA polymerase specialized sigma24 family protein
MKRTTGTSRAKLFSQIFVTMSPGIQSALRRAGASRQDAEDVSQDAFLRLWAKISDGSFRNICAAATYGYLRRGAKTRLHDLHRKNAGKRRRNSVHVCYDSELMEACARRQQV